MAEETEGAVSEETTATPEVSEDTNLEATTDATETAPAPSWTEGIEDEKVLGGDGDGLLVVLGLEQDGGEHEIPGWGGGLPRSGQADDWAVGQRS